MCSLVKLRPVNLDVPELGHVLAIQYFHYKWVYVEILKYSVLALKWVVQKCYGSDTQRILPVRELGSVLVVRHRDRYPHNLPGF